MQYYNYMKNLNIFAIAIIIFVTFESHAWKFDFFYQLNFCYIFQMYSE